MSFDAILKTKIRVPAPHPNGVPRRRLTEMLERGLSGRLTFVTAPAGFGKTTLLAEWLSLRPDRSAAWLSLDETDNDLIKFWRYFIHALSAAAIPELQSRTFPLLQAYPNVSIHTLLDALLQELEDNVGTASRASRLPLRIVLDDYHEIGDESIHQSLSYFIDHLPEGAHLVVASRSKSPLRTAKWRTRGQQCVLTGSELTFTADETRLFCADTARLSLSDEQLADVVRWTEGWAAILQMLSLSLRDRQPRDRGRLLSGIAAHSSDVIQYLLEEVLGVLPEELRQFLLRTSIADRFDAALCDVLTERDDSPRLLEELKQRNLFLVPLDDAGEWHRYHHLFGLVLQNQLIRREPQRWRAWGRMAALHFADRGMLDEAIEQAIGCGDEDLIVRLADRHLYTILHRGELATLARWLNQVAPAKLPLHLVLIHAFALTVTGQFGQAGDVLFRAEKDIASLDEGDKRGELQSGLFFVKVNFAFTTGDYEQWFKYAEQLDVLPENPLFYHFNYNRNEPLVRRTFFGLKGAIPKEILLISLRMLDVLETHGWRQSLFAQYIVQTMAEGFYEMGQFEACEQALREVEAVSRSKRCAGLYIPNRVTAARLQTARGEYGRAMAHLGEAAEAARQWGEPHWLGALQAYEARVLLQQGDLAGAEARLAETGVTAKETPTLYRETEYMTLARLLGARRKEKEALKLLDWLVHLGRRERNLVTITDVSILQALLEKQRGQRTAAAERLHDALGVGIAEGYVRSFVDEGAPMAFLLRDYLKLRESGERPAWEEVPADEVRQLLRRIEAETAGPLRAESGDAVDRLVEPLSERELALMQGMAQGATNRELADRLHLTEGTVKVYFSRIYGKLGVSSRTQALHRARELGLLD
ncbi:LuxR C-terminal-related transcriptional regulator [Cohnella sp. REN36]|uniref:LuxR C-terminal-related transcriptional regulator n=1 Tax=Cohnella sp. REN36 TaxID=2887347 RepID=UPI001D13D581|nr:LuxR C-terminal-related transcriptional regulator [Cohnella sp. REN36]MCC3374791.1 LuxR C-terminal-related transcriptional regulator [Cohnella sp. REN36]